MNYIGKWQVKTMMVESEDGLIRKTIDEIIASATNDHEKRQLEKMKDTILEINADGKVYTKIRVPKQFRDKSDEELTKMLRDSGDTKTIVDNGYILEGNTMDWEMRGDDIFIKLNVQGCTYDANGNEVQSDPWTKCTGENETLKFLTSEYELIK